MLDKPAELLARDREWRALADFALNPALGASLGLVYGRRRQGKTFMLELLSLAAGGFMFTASQLYGQENLRALSEAYRAYTGTEDPVRFATWQEAIDALLRLGERDGRPTLVVLDEFPYLLADEPALPSLIQTALSPMSRAMRDSRTRLILCGSAMTTMRQLLVGTAPLRGRAVLEMNLAPLDFRGAARLWRLDDDPDAAFRVHSLVGGTPAYVGMSGGLIADGDVDGWVHRGLLNPLSAMFREGNVLLYEQPELVDETLYFSVLNAIAGGACRRSEIAGRLSRSDAALTHPLAVLEEVRLIERVEDALVARRPVYRIAEPLIRFHQLVTRPREAAIAALGGDRIWPGVRDTVAAKIHGPHFEELCRQWTLVYAADASRGGFANQVRSATISCREHQQGHELDVVALSENAFERDRVTAIGEAKSGGGPVGVAELARLDHLRDLVPPAKVTDPPRLVLFSRSGFTPNLLARAKTRPDLELIDIDRLYRGD
ncbi:ATP-binding protein [Catellatospora sp. KI3]|uniref:AAA family ATPase n=1 Tax=Catellatospora sp. KI3 TaxID=3041620 RepID=UPI002482601A|nr:ATP-binding protein [Catellatospora sp. KI3]MDI1459934.1 ATP-binding protein [Catellatospora sp. KI3]